MNRYIGAYLLVISMVCGGCGSDSDQLSNLGNFSQPGVNYQGYFLGRVKLPRELRQGPVEIQSLDGQVLQLQADATGWFTYRGSIPPNFRAVARRGADVYEVLHEGTWSGGTLYINPGTTLAVAYVRAHPGVSYSEAETRIQKFYRLPSQFKLSWFSTIESAAFDPVKFFSGVQSSGSLNSYVGQLIARIDSGSVFTEESFVGSVVGDIAKAVFTGPAGATINDTAGAVVSKCGDNFTTAGALTQIEDDLQTISTQINELSDQITQLAAAIALGDTLQHLKTDAQTIESAIGEVRQTALNRQALTDNNAPVPYGQPVDNDTAVGLNQLQSFKTLNALNTTITPIADAVTDTGPTGIYQLFVKNQMTELKLNNDSSYNHYPWRTVNLTNQQLALMGPLINSLEQAAYLTTEVASLSDSDSLATDIFNAREAASDLAYKIQLAAQQVPDGVYSSDLLFDPGNQTIWYNDFLPATSFADAQQYLRQLQVGPYGYPYNGRFDIPTRSQLSNLVTRRVILNTTAAVSNGEWEDTPASDWTNAFSKLGFNTNFYGVVIEGSSSESDRDNQGAYCYDDGNGNKPTIYWWNGTAGGPAKNPSTNEAEPAVGRPDQTSYLGCLFYGVNQEEEQAAYLAPAPLPAFSYFQPGPSPATVGIVNSLQVSQDSSNPLQLKATAQFLGGSYIPSSLFGFTDSSSRVMNNFDITNRVAWKSNNEKAATISNFLYNRDGSAPPNPGLPGPIGQITWHPPLSGSSLSESVTFTGSYYAIDNRQGTSSSLHTNSITIAPPTGLRPVLDHVYATPFNRKYNLTTAGGRTIPITLLAAYADGQLKDVSKDSNTVWTLYDANNNVLNSSNSGGFKVNPGDDPNDLYLSADLPTTTVTFKATYSDQWGSASVNGTMAVVIPNPSITELRPSVGTAAGGITVVIVGEGFTPGTRVTFNGVTAQSTINTSSQITAILPPLGRSITSPTNVPVVVSVPSGASSSGNLFTYSP